MTLTVHRDCLLDPQLHEGRYLYILCHNPLSRKSLISMCARCNIGVALNGVAIYGGAVTSDCELLDVEDSTSEWIDFDYCSGHADASGIYHYHFPPSCLIAHINTVTGADSTTHSGQLGWAYDGALRRHPPRQCLVSHAPLSSLTRALPSLTLRARQPPFQCQYQMPQGVGVVRRALHFHTCALSRLRLPHLRAPGARGRRDDPHRRRLHGRLLPGLLLGAGEGAALGRQL